MNSADAWLYDGLQAQTWQPWVALLCAALTCAGAAHLWKRILDGMADRALRRRLWAGLVVVLVLVVAAPWLRFAWLATLGQVEETRLVSGELRKPGGTRRRIPSCMAVVETERHERWSVTLRPQACSATSQTARIPFVVADGLRWMRQPGRHVLFPIAWLALYAIAAGTLWMIAVLVRWPHLRWLRPIPRRRPRSEAELVERARRAWSAQLQTAKFDASLPEHQRFVERPLFAARPGDDYDVALFRVVDAAEPPTLDTREFWVARKNGWEPAARSSVAGPFRL